jgi:hypothetical protein
MENIGIDKIALTTKDFRVKDLSNTNIFGRNVSIRQGGAELPIYSDLSENKIEANNFYHNGKCAIYDISHNKGLNIHFNPSKVLHPYNLVSTGTELNSHLQAIKKEMGSIGVLTNLDTMNLSRLDLAKNMEMSHPLLVYQDGFRLLKGKRSDSRTAPDGFYVGNKSHETIFYDKGKELKYNKVTAITPENYLRAEIRYKKSDAVKRYSTFNNCFDLMSADPTDISGIYKTYLNDVIFSRSKIGTQMLIDFDSEIEIYNNLKAQMPKGYFGYWLQINSIDRLMNMFGSIENVKRFLTDAGENRMTIYRNIERIKELIATRGSLSTKRNEVTPLSLLAEVKQKFIEYAA